eukprot:Rmarinus@m.23850
MALGELFVSLPSTDDPGCLSSPACPPASAQDEVALQINASQESRPSEFRREDPTSYQVAQLEFDEYVQEAVNRWWGYLVKDHEGNLSQGDYTSLIQRIYEYLLDQGSENARKEAEEFWSKKSFNGRMGFRQLFLTILSLGQQFVPECTSKAYVDFIDDIFVNCIEVIDDTKRAELHFAAKRRKRRPMSAVTHREKWWIRLSRPSARHILPGDVYAMQLANASSRAHSHASSVMLDRRSITATYFPEDSRSRYVAMSVCSTGPSMSQEFPSSPSRSAHSPNSPAPRPATAYARTSAGSPGPPHVSPAKPQVAPPPFSGVNSGSKADRSRSPPFQARSTTPDGASRPGVSCELLGESATLHHEIELLLTGESATISPPRSPVSRPPIVYPRPGSPTQKLGLRNIMPRYLQSQSPKGGVTVSSVAIAASSAGQAAASPLDPASRTTDEATPEDWRDAEPDQNKYDAAAANDDDSGNAGVPSHPHRRTRPASACPTSTAATSQRPKSAVCGGTGNSRPQTGPAKTAGGAESVEDPTHDSGLPAGCTSDDYDAIAVDDDDDDGSDSDVSGAERLDPQADEMGCNPSISALSVNVRTPDDLYDDITASPVSPTHKAAVAPMPVSQFIPRFAPASAPTVRQLKGPLPITPMRGTSARAHAKHVRERDLAKRSAVMVRAQSAKHTRSRGAVLSASEVHQQKRHDQRVKSGRSGWERARKRVLAIIGSPATPTPASPSPPRSPSPSLLLPATEPEGRITGKFRPASAHAKLWTNAVSAEQVSEAAVDSPREAESVCSGTSKVASPTPAAPTAAATPNGHGPALAAPNIPRPIPRPASAANYAAGEPVRKDLPQRPSTAQPLSGPESAVLAVPVETMPTSDHKLDLIMASPPSSPKAISPPPALTRPAALANPEEIASREKSPVTSRTLPADTRTKPELPDQPADICTKPGLRQASTTTHCADDPHQHTAESATSKKPVLHKSPQRSKSAKVKPTARHRPKPRVSSGFQAMRPSSSRAPAKHSSGSSVRVLIREGISARGPIPVPLPDHHITYGATLGGVSLVQPASLQQRPSAPTFQKHVNADDLMVCGSQAFDQRHTDRPCSPFYIRSVIETAGSPGAQPRQLPWQSPGYAPPTEASAPDGTTAPPPTPDQLESQPSLSSPTTRSGQSKHRNGDGLVCLRGRVRRETSGASCGGSGLGDDSGPLPTSPSQVQTTEYADGGGLPVCHSGSLSLGESAADLGSMHALLGHVHSQGSTVLGADSSCVYPATPVVAVASGRASSNEDDDIYAHSSGAIGGGDRLFSTRPGRGLGAPVPVSLFLPVFHGGESTRLQPSQSAKQRASEQKLAAPGRTTPLTRQAAAESMSGVQVHGMRSPRSGVGRCVYDPRESGGRKQHGDGGVARTLRNRPATAPAAHRHGPIRNPQGLCFGERPSTAVYIPSSAIAPNPQAARILPHPLSRRRSQTTTTALRSLRPTSQDAFRKLSRQLDFGRS